MSNIVYVNGAFLPKEDAKISVFDRGFLFADGIYEVSAVINGKLIDNDMHLARLERSTGEIGLSIPATIDQIKLIQLELMRRNQLTEGMVYLQITRGAPPVRDFAFPVDIAPSLVMFTQASKILDAPLVATGMRIKTVPDLRWARRDIKSVALLAQVLARQEALEAGCHEAWMMDGDLVTEGAASTAHIITHDKRVITRSSSYLTLPGCTKLGMQLSLADAGLEIEQRPFSLEEALNASEAFITSAGHLVMPVTEINGTKIGDGTPGPNALKLRDLYIERVLKDF